VENQPCGVAGEEAFEEVFYGAVEDIFFFGQRGKDVGFAGLGVGDVALGFEAADEGLDGGVGDGAVFWQFVDELLDGGLAQGPEDG